MSVRGFNTGSGIEQYDYDYLENKPATPTKESIGLGNVDNTSDMNKPVSTAQEQALSQKVDKVPGMGLSQEDFTSADKEKLEALPTNEELEADLAGKASAEIVAALESAVNDPDNGLETKASAIINTASGAIASFSDGADSMPVKKLVVNVEPQQDLHGYDNPWPAGGGVNKLDLDGSFSASAAGYAVALRDIPTIPAGEYTLAITSSANAAWSTTFLDSEGNAVISFSSNTGNAGRQSKTATITADVSKVRIYVNAATTLSNIQLEAGTVATEYRPYSNICPISGWTGAEIEQTGKNLLDVSVAEIGTAWNGSSNTARARLVIPLKQNTQYTLTMNGSNALDGVFSTLTTVVPPSSISTMTFPYSFDSGVNDYLVLGFNKTAISQADIDALNLQLELGSTVTTDYVPYTGNQISVTFPSEAGTMYKGKVNLTTGELTATHALLTKNTATMNNSETFPGWLNAGVRELIGYPLDTVFRDQTLNIGTSFAVNTNEGGRDILYFPYDGLQGYKMTQSQFVALAIDVQILVPLAQPITVQLDSITLNTLYGTNNIWADCGDSTVEYTCDTRLFIEQLTQPAEDDMTANANIAANKFFMLGNTLYFSTAAIAQGATIIPGTNCNLVSLADALNQLNT